MKRNLETCERKGEGRTPGNVGRGGPRTKSYLKKRRF